MISINMSPRKRALVLRLVGLLLAAVVAACGVSPPTPAAMALATFPGCSAGDVGALVPRLTCTVDEGVARIAVFGYQNSSGASVLAATGTSVNRFDPDPDPRYVSLTRQPPSTFEPGEHKAAFAIRYVPFAGSITWQLGASSASTLDAAPTCGRSTIDGIDYVDGGGERVEVGRDPGVFGAGAIKPTPTPLMGADQTPGTAAVGKLPGAFSVSDDGAARYTIPLELPPGRNGVQPALALAYDHRSNNGPLGVGWSLAGLSQISRCHKVFGFDGVATPITFTDQDRFCFDGQPIVGDLDAGANPLHDPFTRIRVDGRDSNGPVAWIVERKDGRVYRYGRGTSLLAGSRIGVTDDGEPVSGLPGPARVAWLVSDFRDRHFNFVKFEYEDSTVGTAPQGCNAGVAPCVAYEKRLKEITYTHAGEMGAPHKRVAFVHQSRPDPDFFYIGGIAFARSTRLERIEVFGPMPVAEGLVRAYRLEYSVSPTSKRSLLRSVRHCDGAGVCQRPTTFQYEPGAMDFGVQDLGPVPADSWVGDFDQDGRDDVLYLTAGNVFVRFGQADGLFGAPTLLSLPGWLLSDPGAPAARVYREFGQTRFLFPVQCFAGETKTGKLAYDILLDFAAWDSATATFKVHGCPPPSAYKLSRPDGDLVHYPPTSVPGDLNGDGQPDGVALDASGWFGSGSLDEKVFTLPLDGTPATWVSYLTTTTPKKRQASRRVGSSVVTVPLPYQDGNTVAAIGDWNGDGLVDYLALPPTPFGAPGGSFYLDFGINVGGRIRRAKTDPLPTTAVPAVVGLMPWTGLLPFDFYQRGAPVVLSTNSAGSLMVLDPGAAFVPGASPSSVIPAGVIVAAGGPILGESDLGQVAHRRVLDVNGDGLDDLLLAGPWATVVNRWRLLTRRGGRADHLVGVVDGHGDDVAIEYENLSESSYRPELGAECTYPLACGTRALSVVKRARVHGAVPATLRSYRYEYAEARSDERGLGFLGFKTRTTIHEQTGATTVVHRDRLTETVPTLPGLYPYSTVTTSEESAVTVDGRSLRSATTYEWLAPVVASSGAYVVFPLRTFESADEVAGTVTTPLRRVETTYGTREVPGFDAWGNLVHRTIRAHLAGTTDTFQATYAADPDRWLISKPVQQTVTSSVDPTATFIGPTTVTRTTSFVVEPTMGDVEQVIVEPSGGTEVRLVTRFVRNGAGLVTSAIAEDATGAKRRSDVEYDPVDGTHPAVSTNPLGHVTRTVVHGGLGVPVVSVDPNGVSRRFEYDGFGRLLLAASPTCAACAPLPPTTTTYGTAKSPVAVYSVTVAAPGQATVTTEYDPVGRTVFLERQGASGTQQVGTTYDPVFVEQPWEVVERLESGAVQRTRHEYDAAGRLVRRYGPMGLVRRTYLGATSTQIDEVGDARKHVHDEHGRLVAAIDVVAPGGAPLPGPGGGTYTADLEVRHLYGPFGQLAETRDPGGNATVYRYDALGRLTLHRDRDSGETTYRYDAFGQLVSVSDALHTTTIGYDALGRPIGRASDDGTTCFEYDLGTGAIGQLSRAIRFAGPGEANAVVEQTKRYDALGRPIEGRQRISGPIDSNLATEVGYHPGTGQVASLRYVGEGTDLTVGVDYMPTGHLQALRVDDRLFWRVERVNLRDQIVEESFGNGAITEHTYEPSTGWLLGSRTRLGGTTVQDLRLRYRADGLVTSVEDVSSADLFEYDPLKRLTKWYGAWGNVRYEYDLLGNLEKRTTDAEGSVKVETFTSGPSGYVPTLPGSPPVLRPIHGIETGPAGTYQYDLTGNQVEGPDRKIEWTSFHKPQTVDTTGRRDRYAYGPFGERVLRMGEETVVYHGAHEVRRDLHVVTISNDQRTVGQVSWRPGESKTPLYSHPDHLGSPTVVTDDSGTVPVGGRRRFEPFGLRVEQDKPSLAYAGPVLSVDRHTFTGHEDDREHGLVNMGGRIYDPTVGRFMSPDPVVGAGNESQSWNRFAYVHNNPVNSTDPSGFCDIGACPPDGGSILGATASWLFGKLFSGASTTQLPAGNKWVIQQSGPPAAPPLVRLTTLAPGWLPFPMAWSGFQTWNLVTGGMSGMVGDALGFLRGVPASGVFDTSCMGWANVVCGPGSLTGQRSLERWLRRDVDGVLIELGRMVWTAAEVAYEVGSVAAVVYGGWGIVRGGWALGRVALTTYRGTPLIRAIPEFLTGQKGLFTGSLARLPMFSTEAASYAAEETVSMYRAVSPAEFYDVMKTGAFRPAPGGASLAGKQFGLNLGEVVKFADQYPELAAVLKVDVPKSSFSAFHFSRSIDPSIFRSGVVTVQPGAQQTLLNQTIISLEHVF